MPERFSQGAVAIAGLASGLLTIPWFLYSYVIWAIGYEGSDCNNPDLTNCGDEGTALYAWTQAVLALVGIPLLLVAAGSSLRHGLGDSTNTGLKKAWVRAAVVAISWCALVATRVATAGQPH